MNKKLQELGEKEIKDSSNFVTERLAIPKGTRKWKEEAKELPYTEADKECKKVTML